METYKIPEIDQYEIQELLKNLNSRLVYPQWDWSMPYETMERKFPRKPTGPMPIRAEIEVFE